MQDYILPPPPDPGNTMHMNMHVVSKTTCTSKTVHKENGAHVCIQLFQVYTLCTCSIGSFYIRICNTPLPVLLSSVAEPLGSSCTLSLCSQILQGSVMFT